jgi:hypothetical protein
MKHILLPIIYLLLSLSAKAQTCSGDKIDKQISIFKAIKSVKTFVYEQSDGFKKEGGAEGQMLNRKYAYLKWMPDQGEGGVFLIALDLTQDKFFIYHADNLRVKSTFVPSQFDSQHCSIKFKITENEFTTLKVNDSNGIEIHVEFRESPKLPFKKEMSWLFKS